MVFLYVNWNNNDEDHCSNEIWAVCRDVLDRWRVVGIFNSFIIPRYQAGPYAPNPTALYTKDEAFGPDLYVIPKLTVNKNDQPIDPDETELADLTVWQPEQGTPEPEREEEEESESSTGPRGWDDDLSELEDDPLLLRGSTYRK